MYELQNIYVNLLNLDVLRATEFEFILLSRFCTGELMYIGRKCCSGLDFGDVWCLKNWKTLKSHPSLPMETCYLLPGAAYNAGVLRDVEGCLFVSF